MADDGDDGAGAGGMKKLLHPYFIRAVEVPASQLILTTMGRPQRQHGVTKLKAAIEEQGFLESHAPLVTLMSVLEDVDTLEDLISDRSSRFKVIDGNHRVAAQQSIDKECLTDTKIPVRVHQPMQQSIERLVAQGKRMMPAFVIFEAATNRGVASPVSSTFFRVCLNVSLFQYIGVYAYNSRMSDRMYKYNGFLLCVH